MAFGFKFTTGTDGTVTVLSDEQPSGVVIDSFILPWVSDQVTVKDYSSFYGSKILVSLSPINAGNSATQAIVNQTDKTVTLTCRTGTTDYPVGTFQYNDVFVIVIGL